MVLENLAPSTEYLVEVLNDQGASFVTPIYEEFRTRDELLLSRQSNGWFLLENEANGAFVDPVESDPDFLESWANQSIGSYSSGVPYDGPDFVANQSSPFVSEGLHFRPGQTELSRIDSLIRPVWLLKEIDGGPTGFRSLTLEGLMVGGFAAYINGRLVMERALAPGTTSAWDQRSSWASLSFQQALPEDVILEPGPNLLAISLHPISLTNPAGSEIGAEFELRGQPAGIFISDLSFDYESTEEITVRWQTSRPATTEVRYGRNLLQSPSSRTDETLATNHSLTILAPDEGGEFQLEIVATDEEGNSTRVNESYLFDPPIPRQPFLQKATPSSITVKWRTRMPGETWLRFGTNPSDLEELAEGFSSVPALTDYLTTANEFLTDHTVELSGLEPGTRYYYQIADSSNNGPHPAEDLTRFFTTPPAISEGVNTKIWVVGNSGQATREQKRVTDAYLNQRGEHPADVFLALGDNGDPNGTDLEYQRALFDSYAGVLKNTPIWPTAGNRDVEFPLNFNQVFELPGPASATGPRRYYSFDHGNIHFVCLDSTLVDQAEMLQWLHRDLQQNRAEWLIAYFHHSPYTKGNHDSDREEFPSKAREKLVPVLASYGVDLILGGESDQYERTHLMKNLTGPSDSYDPALHAVDPGYGSPFGETDSRSGLFRYGSDSSHYEKALGSSNGGFVAVTLGTSSVVGKWGRGSDAPETITNPRPHPVHAATLAVHGSLVVEVEDRRLVAYFLDLNGQIRDHFEIRKVEAESPAIAWWRLQFGSFSYPTMADWHANPDGDSFSNIDEFVHGFDPKTPDAPLPLGVFVNDRFLQNGVPTEWFTIRYPAREGTGVRIEESEGLRFFTGMSHRPFSSTSRIQRISPPNESGISLWEARVLKQDQETQFFRVRTSQSNSN
jgi:hypothetical protein